MAQVLLQDIDDEVVERLKAQAAERGITLEQRIEELLKQGAGSKRLAREEWIERSRKIRAMQLEPVERESWELIREDRDSR
jgi:hypothetical protein